MSITSSQSNRNSQKFRIVFLGDMAVGKSSIIERYTNNKFNESHIVIHLLSRPLLESILVLRIFPEMDSILDYRCGIQLDNKDIEA